MVTLLNTSILTSFGSYNYEPITLETARDLVAPTDATEYYKSECMDCKNQRPTRVCDVCGSTKIDTFPAWFESAIGHESTAEILTELLSVDVRMNRIEYRQAVGDEAIVFKLKGRPPEGTILTIEQIEEIGYEFGLLTRKA